MQLRPYQADFVNDIRAHFANGSTAPLAQAPTGMGKTVCLAYMSDAAARKGNRVGVLVHRQELVLQTGLALAKMGIQHGVIAPTEIVRAAIMAQSREIGRSYFNRDALVQIASIQTLSRRLSTVIPFDFLMIDEAHHAVAGSWARVIGAMPKAKILGVTATPERLDGKGLGREHGGPFTSLVNGPDVVMLVENGFLAPARIFAPTTGFDVKGIRIRAGDFDRGSLAKRLDKPTITGDAINHYKEHCPGVPAIAFCASVDHAKHVAAQFCEAGYRARSIDGNTNGVERRAAIAALGRGDLKILTSCEIISEGTDVPIVGAAILLRPTQSLGLHLQQVGRVLRPYPGKARAVILDHVGNNLRLGLPDDAREWSLAGKAGRKKRDDDAEPNSTRQCASCNVVFSTTRRACPNCGVCAPVQAREIEQRDGKLVEVDVAALRRARAREQSQADSLEALIKLGVERGYKYPRSWASHVMNAREKKRAVV